MKDIFIISSNGTKAAFQSLLEKLDELNFEGIEYSEYKEEDKKISSYTDKRPPFPDITKIKVSDNEILYIVYDELVKNDCSEFAKAFKKLIKYDQNKDNLYILNHKNKKDTLIFFEDEKNYAEFSHIGNGINMKEKDILQKTHNLKNILSSIIMDIDFIEQSPEDNKEKLQGIFSNQKDYYKVYEKLQDFFSDAEVNKYKDFFPETQIINFFKDKQKIIEGFFSLLNRKTQDLLQGKSISYKDIKNYFKKNIVCEEICMPSDFFSKIINIIVFIEKKSTSKMKAIKVPNSIECANIKVLKEQVSSFLLQIKEYFVESEHKINKNIISKLLVPFETTYILMQAYLLTNGELKKETKENETKMSQVIKRTIKNNKNNWGYWKAIIGSAQDKEEDKKYSILHKHDKDFNFENRVDELTGQIKQESIKKSLQNLKTSNNLKLFFEKIYENKNAILKGQGTIDKSFSDVIKKAYIELKKFKDELKKYV